MANENVYTPVRPLELPQAPPEGRRISESATTASVPRSGVGAPRAERGERDAILESLYVERRALLRMKRAGDLSAADGEYLDELNRYIDRWEEPDVKAAETSDVWSRLEEIAASLLDVRANIERHRK